LYCSRIKIKQTIRLERRRRIMLSAVKIFAIVARK